MSSTDFVKPDDVPVQNIAVCLQDTSPIDPVKYSLSPEEAEFFKATTGINDDEALKAHILSVQEKAYKVSPYPFISRFGFLRLGITKNPNYSQVVKLGRERPGAILLDIGCCFAVDARKAAADGFPPCNIITFDLVPEYGDFSHALFNTTGDTFEGHFIAGDAFGPAILSVIPPCQQPPSLRPKLSNLTSLNPLHGHCAVINAANFFHLFDEEKQLHMARALAGLLSPEPGSVICGRNLAASKKGEAINQLGGRHCSHFCHSPESWVDLWDGLVFEKGKVKVEAELYSREHLNYRTTNMVWSITRL